MKILKITLHNLNSLRIKETIDFTDAPLRDSGLFAITGDTGSGKTTILDALTLALYGRIHRNKEVAEVMTYGETESLAEVEFESKQGIFRANWKVWRANKKADGNLRGPERSLAKWNAKIEEFEIVAERIREVDRGVEQASGLDYDRFCRSVLLSQGDFAAFLKAGEKERSDLLERITGREIYTQLSKAAFERSKLEENALKGLQQQKEGLNILEKEEVKALKEEQKDKKVIAQQFKKELNFLQKKQQQQKKYLELQKKNEEKTTALSILEKQKVEGAADFKRLEEFTKVRAFQAPLFKLDQQMEQQLQGQEEIKILRAALPAIKRRKEEISQQLSQQKVDVKTLKTDFFEQKPRLQKVMKLDVLLAEKSLPLEARKVEFLTQEKEEEELKNRLNENENQQVKLNKEITDFKKWLKSNTSLENLSADLPKIELHREELRAIYIEKKDAEKLVSQKKEALNKIALELQKAEKGKEKEKAAFDKLKTAFDKANPGKFAQNRQELIGFLYADIEQVGKVKNDLQQLHQINEDYEILLKELSEWEVQIESLRNEEFEISKQLMSSTDALDVMEEHLEFKLEIYEQQQLISNYEKDRSTLKEGDPCPLCFSQKHPFRLKKIVPFVNKAKEELKKARQQRELVYQSHKILIDRHSTLAQEIEQLTGGSQEKGGQVARQVEKIENFEQKMSAFASTLDADLFSMSRSNLLAQKLEALEKETQSKKKALAEMQSLVNELGEKEKISKDSDAIFLHLEAEVKAKKQSLEHTQQQWQQLEIRFEKASKKINGLLKKYDCTFALETAAKMFDSLKKKQTDFTENTNEIRKRETELSRLLSQLTEIKNQLKAATKKQISLQKTLEKEQTAFDKIQGERTSLFGEKDAQIALDNLEKYLEKSDQSLQEKKEKLAEVSASMKSKEHLLLDKQKKDKTLTVTITKGEAKLLLDLAKANINALADLRAKLLDEREAQQIESIQKKLAEQETALLQTIADLQSEIRSLNIDSQEGIDVGSLQEQVMELDRKYSEIEREVGGVAERLRENDARKKQAKSLLKQINEQQKEYERWAKLNDLIGQADGKKFRIFAQGLTLKKLVSLANIHLQNLNERYFIRKPKDQNLHLEIVDTFQADNRRSMLTLSGGESFLVSLALALGLSDLAGQKTQIQSLFIDEGFGSLDENTLDMALATLENLRSSGKTIGLISHVNTLKERIGTQIQVHKMGNGFSRVEVSA